jgi:antitoxin (DNA-binding transcriptional repressor) of toxin-antitoxin stability system
LIDAGGALWREAFLMVYTVHMKRVTATEARKNWFRLLDEVAEGEVVLIEREGARLVLQLAEQGEPLAKAPDYRGLIRVPDADEADQWGWEWDGSPEGLRPRRTGPEP